MKLARHICLAILLLPVVAACQGNPARTDEPKGEVQKRVEDGKAYWEEKGRTVAGEKIYRKVENVEGLLLMKVRPVSTAKEWADRNWPGAAFARENDGNEYITTFLGYEHAAYVGDKPLPITINSRGFVSTTRHTTQPIRPGYRWVEVIDKKDGRRYRYTGSNKVVGRMDANAPNVKIDLQRNPNFDLNIYGWVLDRVPASGPSPRYGVTYEDHVIPEERYLGIASSTIKVLDLKTNEVLGEMTRYAWSPGRPSGVNPSPWLTAYRCPDHAYGVDAATRKFVDQVLIPAKEK
jgi:hypothetical protein